MAHLSVDGGVEQGTFEALAPVLAQFCVGRVKTVERTCLGTQGSTWVALTSAGRFVIRRMQETQDISTVALEHAILAHLLESEIPYQVPRPCLTSAGRSLVLHKRRIYWAYPFIRGDVMSLPWRQEFAQVARAMTTLHGALSTMRLPTNACVPEYINVRWLLEDFERDLHLPNSGRRRDVKLQKYYKILPIALERLLKVVDVDVRRFNQHALHYDWNPNNLLRCDHDIVGIIDFDSCRVGPAIQDVAAFLRRNCVVGTQFDTAKANYFIAQYRKYRQLSDEELALLPKLAAIDAAEQLWWDAYRLRQGGGTSINVDELAEMANSLGWLIHNDGAITSCLASAGRS